MYRFRFLIKGFIFEKKFKKSKSCPFSEGFMHKTCLKTKQKFLKKSKFSFSIKSLQIHSVSRKSVPKQFATLEEWLGIHFDSLHPFKTTFQKSNFRAPKPLFAFWRLRTLESQAFHGLQNMVGASSIWAFWIQYCRQNKFIYSLEASLFPIFN